MLFRPVRAHLVLLSLQLLYGSCMGMHAIFRRCSKVPLLGAHLFLLRSLGSTLFLVIPEFSLRFPAEIATAIAKLYKALVWFSGSSVPLLAAAQLTCTPGFRFHCFTSILIQEWLLSDYKALFVANLKKVTEIQFQFQQIGDWSLFVEDRSACCLLEKLHGNRDARGLPRARRRFLLEIEGCQIVEDGKII